MNPIILYNDIFSKGTLTSSATKDGFGIQNATDNRTYTKWKAANPGNNYIEHEVSSTPANAVALAGHNFGTALVTLEVKINVIDDVWTTLATAHVTTDDPIIITFSKYSSFDLRMHITNSTSSVPPEAGVIYLGEYLEFPFPPDAILQPFSESVVPKFETVDSGNLLSVENRFNPFSISHRYSNVERDPFLKDYLKFWNNHGKYLKPFFYAWDLDNRPNDVFYARFSEKHTHSIPLSNLKYADLVQLNLVSV